MQEVWVFDLRNLDDNGGSKLVSRCETSTGLIFCSTAFWHQWYRTGLRRVPRGAAWRNVARRYWVSFLCTIRLNKSQVVFHRTLDFMLVYTQEGLPELGSSFKEIFLGALFEKKGKKKFPLLLQWEFKGLIKRLFGWQIWIPDRISFRLIGHTMFW